VYYLASRIQTELLNIAYRLEVVVELNGPIFWKTESIRIDSSSESNRIESNRIANWNALAMHNNVYPLVHQRVCYL